MDIRGIEDSLHALQTALSEAANELEWSHDRTGRRRCGQSAKLGIITSNIRHTPTKGAVTVILAEGAGGSVSLSVSNPGAEIPAEHPAKIFDRFYQVDPSLQRHSEGAGLGLSIVKSIVEAHGGEVKVHSGEDAMTFTMRLPAPKPANCVLTESSCAAYANGRKSGCHNAKS